MNGFRLFKGLLAAGWGLQGPGASRRAEVSAMSRCEQMIVSEGSTGDRRKKQMDRN